MTESNFENYFTKVKYCKPSLSLQPFMFHIHKKPQVLLRLNMAFLMLTMAINCVNNTDSFGTVACVNVRTFCFP